MARFGGMKPKVGVVKKVEPGPVEQRLAVRVSIRAKENCRGKDSLEALDDPGVVAAIFGKMEEAQHLDSVSEMYGTALLFHRQCRDPNGNHAILSKWQPEVRMSDDVKKEFAIAPPMYQLGRWRAAEWKPAENERASIERQFLTAARSLLADQANRFDLLESPLRDPEGRCFLAD